MEDLDEEEIEALQVLAQSDLRSAEYAERLLEAFGLDTANTTHQPEEPTKPDNTPSIEAQNEPKDSIFAY